MAGSRIPGPIGLSSTTKDPNSDIVHAPSSRPGPIGMDNVPVEANHRLEARTAVQEARLSEIKKALAHRNVIAFIKAIAEAEGGGYDFKYGAVKGKKNDPWRFTDFSTHPGAGFGGKTTASGMYQITVATWRDFGTRSMGLTDFSPETQDLIAVNLLRSVGAIDKIMDGDIAAGLSKASMRWAALPKGPRLGNRVPNQPYVSYEHFEEVYKAAGGYVKK